MRGSDGGTILMEDADMLTPRTETVSVRGIESQHVEHDMPTPAHGDGLRARDQTCGTILTPDEDMPTPRTETVSVRGVSPEAFYQPAHEDSPCARGHGEYSDPCTG